MSSNGHHKTDRKHYLPIEEVDDLLLNARGDKNYVKCYRDYWRIMGKTTALFLCDLMDRARMHLRRLKKDPTYRQMKRDRYFRCSAKYLERAGWSKKEQEYSISVLKDKKFILLRRKGPSGTRWVKLCMTAIELAADKAAFVE